MKPYRSAFFLAAVVHFMAFWPIAGDAMIRRDREAETVLASTAQHEAEIAAQETLAFVADHAATAVDNLSTPAAAVATGATGNPLVGLGVEWAFGAVATALAAFAERKRRKTRRALEIVASEADTALSQQRKRIIEARAIDDGVERILSDVVNTVTPKSPAPLPAQVHPFPAA